MNNEMFERRKKYHEVMFGDAEAEVFKKKNGALKVEFSDGDSMTISEREYAKGFNMLFCEYAQMELPKKKKPTEKYRIIACGKYFEGGTLDDAVAKALDRLDRKGCLDEAVAKEKAKDAIHSMIGDMLSSIEE